MPDTFTDRLARLAPDVDTAAGRELFERRRSDRAPTPRWWLRAAVVVLLVAGVVGVWAAARDGDDGTLPAGPVDDGSSAAVFEVRLVEQTGEPFGELAAFDSAEALAWGLGTAAELGWAIDWDREIALVATMPDNACPDTLVRFDVDGDVWTPVFEEQATACEDPLLSWLYVVAIDRSALPPQVTFRIPTDDVFDLPERTATLSVTPATDGPVTSGPVTLEPTGVVVPLPEQGTPTLHSTSLGLLWVILHDDGTVAVLPATTEHEADEDQGDVGPLARLVLAADDGRSFSAGGRTWDAHGRSVNGGRENDLVGFAGLVADDEVEVLRSDAARIPGTADPIVGADHAYLETTLGEIDRVFAEPIDPPTFLTLSSTGPIWRYLDATLVVEDGVGRICEVPDNAPVPELVTCDAADIVLDTGIASTNPEVTSWFHAPILVFEDPFGGLTTVIPLGGTSSRNDAVPDGFVPVEPIAVVETGSAAPMRIVTETDASEVPALRDLDLSAVAWDEAHVLVLTIEGSGCPIAVTGLSPFGDGRWTVEAEQQGTACRAELTDWLNVVPIPRGALPSGATIDVEGATTTWP